MNSWKSSGLAAWTPPLSTLKQGTGRRGGWPPIPGRYSNSSLPPLAASALVKAMDTPRIALAPSRDLFGVPSRARRLAEFADGLEAAPNNGVGNFMGDVVHCGENAESAEAMWIVIAQFHGLVCASGGTGGDHRPCACAVGQGQPDHQGGSAARVQDFHRVQRGDCLTWHECPPACSRTAMRIACLLDAGCPCPSLDSTNRNYQQVCGSGSYAPAGPIAVFRIVPRMCPGASDRVKDSTSRL